MAAAPIRVLVIEDDADVRSYLVNLLHAHGYRVTAAAGAQEGLALIRGLQPSLVVLDAMLSGDDAQRIYSDLRYEPDLHHIPVMLLSTLSRRALWGSRVYGAGTAHKRLPKPDAFLSKPPEAEDFLAAVADLTTGCGCIDKDEVP